MAKYSGSGWHFQTTRHSNARKYGKAGGSYAGWRTMTSAQRHNAKMDRIMENWHQELKEKDNLSQQKYNKSYDELSNEEKHKIDYKHAEKKHYGYAERDFKTFPLKNGYEIIAHWEKTRNGFRHIVVLMKDGDEVDRAKATYLNRTWERFDYESAIHKLLGQNPELMNEQQRKDYLDALSNKNIEKINKEFGMIGAIASLGDVLGKNQKERIDWKARMIKAGLGSGIEMPEDWDTLSEGEKETRLNKVIEFTKQKKNYGRSSLQDFIKNNRQEIDEAIKRAVPNAKINDEERRMWILNDEGLYGWAKSEGVNI